MFTCCTHTYCLCVISLNAQARFSLHPRSSSTHCSTEQHSCWVFVLPCTRPPTDLDLTSSSPPWEWIAGLGPAWPGSARLGRQTHTHTHSLPNPEPQLQRSWRYILSSACFLASTQTRNEWSRSPQPGATPSALFTLLPFTHSSCSSPNDAGLSYWWSKAGRELFLSLARLQTKPLSAFLKLNFITGKCYVSILFCHELVELLQLDAFHLGLFACSLSVGFLSNARTPKRRHL